MLVEKLKELQEEKRQVQRRCAADFEIDTASVSKVASNEKYVNFQHYKKLLELEVITENELLTLRLADRIFYEFTNKLIDKKVMYFS